MVAGLGCCCSSTLSSQSVLGRSALVFENRQVGSLRSKTLRRRILKINAEVDYVNSEEAKRLIAEGYAILDVRDKSQFERAHIKDCHHVPLFIENTDNDPGTIIKRQLHNNFSGLFYGLPFTKPNPDFIQSIKSQFPADRKLLLVCQEGLRNL